MASGKDFDHLPGFWSVSTLEVDAQSMPREMLASARIEIKSARFISTGMDADYAGTLELNPSKRPRQIDMKFDAGPEKGNTNLGIYEIDGDTWKLCLATRGKVRPCKFATTPGSGFALETLTRGEAAVRVPKSKKVATPSESGSSATEFEGDWTLVSAFMDGKPMKDADVQWVKRVTRGNQTTVYAGPQVMLKVEFTHDPSKSPKATDYLNMAGPNKGKTQYGIYEFEGGLLKFHVAAAGAKRPTDFKAGNRSTLTIWKRA
jgi:uncharacterized protein (TIGR03067 family)